MKKLVRRFLKFENAPSATSYAVLLAVLAVGYLVVCSLMLE